MLITRRHVVISFCRLKMIQFIRFAVFLGKKIENFIFFCLNYLFFLEKGRRAGLSLNVLYLFAKDNFSE